jgi:hypothetical protein
MGAVKQPVATIVDLAAAERAFLLSAKYAESKTHAVAMGFRCAGWAAYCRGNLDDAINYSRKAVRYDPKLAEAHFQLAKAFMHTGRFEEAARPLRNAICLDVIYVIKSAIDPDFQRHPRAMGETFASMRQELHEESERFDHRFALAERRYKILAQCIKTLTVPFRVSGTEQQQIESVWAFREEAKAQASTNTIFGHSLAIALNRNAEGLHGLLERLRTRAFAAFDLSIKPLYGILNSRRGDMNLFDIVRGFRVWILVLGYVPWMAFWLYVTPTKMPQFLCGSLFVVGWALVVYVGLPILCGLLECILFVPKLILDALWEHSIGAPARKRLKELEILKERLERAFA